MENKPLFYLESAKVVNNNESPYVEEKEIEIKPLYFEGEGCEKEFDDICENPKCHYVHINIKNGEKIWFTCGRRDHVIRW